MNTTISNRLKQFNFAILVGLMILQTGCKKNEEKNLNSLNGTVWKYNWGDDEEGDKMTLSFQESTWKMVDIFTGYTNPYGPKTTDTTTQVGPYEYNHPVVTMRGYVDEDGNPMTLTGVVSDNQIEFTIGVVFIKQ